MVLLGSGSISVVLSDSPDWCPLFGRGGGLSYRVEQSRHRFVYEHFRGEPAQSGYLLGPARDGSSGHVRLLVPEEETPG